MPKCVYCGLPAGAFHNAHPTCEHRVTAGRRAITSFMRKTEKQTDYFLKRNEINKIIEQYYLSSSIAEAALFGALKSRLEEKTINHPLEAKDAKEIEMEARGIGLSDDAILALGLQTEMRRADELRTLGSIRRIRPTDTRGIVISKGEEAVKAFDGVDYEEDVNKRITIRQSSGASGRVMRGLYVNQSKSKSETHEHIERVWKDCGCLLLTKSSVYFKGSQHALKISFNDIIALDYSSEGFSVMKKSANARWRHFVLRGLDGGQLTSIARTLLADH